MNELSAVEKELRQRTKVLNAIKYTPWSGNVGIQIKENSDCFETTVSDTGIGISQKDLPHIFDDFIDKPAQPEDLIQKVEELLKIKISKWVNWPEKQKKSVEE